MKPILPTSKCQVRISEFRGGEKRVTCTPPSSTPPYLQDALLQNKSLQAKLIILDDTMDFRKGQERQQNELACGTAPPPPRGLGFLRCEIGTVGVWSSCSQGGFQPQSSCLHLWACYSLSLPCLSFSLLHFAKCYSSIRTQLRNHLLQEALLKSQSGSSTSLDFCSLFLSRDTWLFVKIVCLYIPPPISLRVFWGRGFYPRHRLSINNQHRFWHSGDTQLGCTVHIALWAPAR